MHIFQLFGLVVVSLQSIINIGENQHFDYIIYTELGATEDEASLALNELDLVTWKSFKSLSSIYIC